MRGTYSILVENRRLQYKFTIRRNITIIRGDSATGKTTLIEMIQDYNDNGPESGVSLQCTKPCVTLSGRYWQNELTAIHDSIVFIDEGNRFVLSEEFAKKIKATNNYYVIVTRERLENIPYSVEEIYGIRSSGKYGTLRQTYHEIYQLYTKDEKLPSALPQEILTEDSHSGYQFFQEVARQKHMICTPADGKSNIFNYLLAHTKESILVIADGAAFGPEIGRIDELMKIRHNIYLYLPESFEWLLLKSGLIKSNNLSEILNQPANFIESQNFFSWEQYFSALLIDSTVGTIWSYQKKQINPIYLHKNNVKKVIAIMAPIFTT